MQPLPPPALVLSPPLLARSSPVPDGAGQTVHIYVAVGPHETPVATRQAPESTVGPPCGSLSAGNIRRIFGRIFEMPCA
eukprot:314964-Prorocentrum_minimum.AAC.1